MSNVMKPINLDEDDVSVEEMEQEENVDLEEADSVIEEEPLFTDLEPTDESITDGEKVNKIITSYLSKSRKTIRGFFALFLQAIDESSDLYMKDYKTFLYTIQQCVSEEEFPEYKRLFAKVVLARQNRIEDHDKNAALIETKQKLSLSISQKYQRLNLDTYTPKTQQNIEKAFHLANQRIYNLSLQNNLEEAAKGIEKQFEASLESAKTKKASKKKKIIWISSVTAFLVCFILIFCIGAIPRVTYRQYDERYAVTDFREVAGIKGLYMPFHFPMKNVVIDEENMGKPVIAIGKNAFKGENIESITIPDSVYIILEGAFADCTSLKHISYDEETKENSLHNIQTIEVNAFKNCTRLESLTISPQIEQISSIAFDGCSRNFKLIYSGSYSSWSEKYIYVPVSVEYHKYTIMIDNEIFVEVEYGEKFSLGRMEYKKGYTRDGYYMDNTKIADVEGEGLAEYSYKRDIRVTRVYTPNRYEINFDYTAILNIPSITVEYDSTFNCPIPSSSTSDSSVFIGWYYDGTRITDEYGSALKPYDYTESIRVYPKFNSDFTITTSKIVRVNFETNGGTQVESQLVSSDSPMRFPEIPTKNGYIFVAWYKDPEFVEQFQFDETLDESITLYARWAELAEYDELIEINNLLGNYYVGNTYFTYYVFVPRISQDLTFYSTGGGDVIGYLYDETKINQLAMDDDHGDDFNFKMTYSVKANTLYYLAVKSYSAGFDALIYIKGDYEDTSLQPSVTINNFTQSVKYNKEFEVPVVEIEGYRFEGYYLADTIVPITTSDGKSIGNYRYAEDIALYPWYTLETYTITYLDENGLYLWTGNPESYTIENNITLSPASKYLYTFVDWYDNPEFAGDPIRTIANQTGNLVLYAKMIPAVCSVRIDEYISPSAFAIVTFNSNGGTSVDSQVLDVDSPKLIFPSVPQKTGYIFKGWYIDQECTKRFEFHERITESIELYAGWERIPTDGGECYTISPMNYSSRLNPYTLYTTNTGTSVYGVHNHIYFASQKGGYITIHYAVPNAVLNNKVGLDVRNVTQNYQHLQDTPVQAEYSSITLWVNYGDIIQISAHRTETTSSPAVYIYFSDIDIITSSELCTQFSITAGTTFSLPVVQKEGYTFEGYYSDRYFNTRVTDENGNGVDLWQYGEDVVLYPKYSSSIIFKEKQPDFGLLFNLIPCSKKTIRCVHCYF